MAESSINLKYGFKFEDLFEPAKLKELAEKFYEYYQAANPSQFLVFAEYRDSKAEGYDLLLQSKILIDSARHLQDFISEFFGIQNELEELKKHAEYEQAVLFVKKDFIQRKVFKNLHASDVQNLNYAELNNKVNLLKENIYQALDWKGDEEHSTAVMIDNILKLESDYKNFIDNRPAGITIPEDSVKKITDIKEKLTAQFATDIVIPASKNAVATDEDKYNFGLINSVTDILQKWCFARYFDGKGKQEIKDWILYKFPRDLDYNDLVYNKIRDENTPEKFYGDEHHFKKRDGFKLTDKPASFRVVMNEIEYCVFCRERKKDSCSKGYKDKDGAIRENPLGIKLNGCPLNEKISEMHTLKNEGLSLASLAMVMIDNPMCPGTGHRICNDCMKACIYQKQEPVNIPKVESNVLKDILGLPWGFEIYSLLTRWNPLNVKSPYELPYNGKNILVVGMGPAGYTLSQHLLQSGFGVVGIDALKIEPQHKEITGYYKEGKYIKPEPLKYFSEVYDELDKRILAGFGGVTEYGITVRWDKNFLKVIYLTLLRRKYFRLYDGVRFGGTIETDDAWEMGFDHIAMTSGAGKPTIVDMKNNLARGVRKSSDILMSLQLCGASHKDSLCNLMLQLPAVVIGGGLTAVDTATESSAYYPVQVEKFLERYEKISAETGDNNFWQQYSDEEKEIAKTFIEHGRELRGERKRAEEEKRKPNIISLVRKWGGVTIAYRKSIQESPAYRLNHEEIIESLEEGINYFEKISPIEVLLNNYGSTVGVKFRKQSLDENGKWIELDEYVTLPAKSILVAAGTSPNVQYEKEHPGSFELDEKKQYFQTYSVSVNGSVELTKTNKGEKAFFTSYNKNGKLISVYGDNHPIFVGSVVKAMASAKEGSEEIKKVLLNSENKSGDGNFFLELVN